MITRTRIAGQAPVHLVFCVLKFLGERRHEEGRLSLERLAGLGAREQREAMGAARVDVEIGAIARGDPARVHEQAVVQQRVTGADREERGTEPVQVRKQR